jgi:hypothetical protein
MAAESHSVQRMCEHQDLRGVIDTIPSLVVKIDKNRFRTAVLSENT